MKESKTRSNVLIVDDTLNSLRVLSGILNEHGYAVRGACDGATALMTVDEKAPDLILLDVRMPNMDGYEVCRRLKGNARTRDIPVLFISALDQVQDKVKGFEIGGVDYITKPFQVEEVLARVKNHLALYRLKNELEQRVEERTAELAQANASLQAEIAEREQTERALRNAKEYAENLIETANVMVVGLDNNGNVTVFNQAAERITGYTRQELEGKNWFQVLVPKDRYPHVWDEFTRLLSGAWPSTFENYILTKAGQERLIAWQNNDLHENGSTVGTISFGMDITEHKQVEDELREAHQLLETIYDHTHIMVAYLDPQFNFLQVNRAYAQADEREPSFFLGKNHFDLYPDAANEAIFRRVVETGQAHFELAKAFEYAEHPERGVSHWDWSLVPIKDSKGMVTGLTLTVLNVTERVRAEEALRASEATARALLNAPADTILLLDTSGILLDVNETAVRSYARPREELIGISVWDLFSPDLTARRKPYIDQVIQSGEPVRLEDERDGSWFDNVLYPIFDERQEVSKVAVIARDITERKRAQVQLEESEARLRALFENSGYAMGVAKSGVHVMVNPAYLDLFGYKRETELIGTSILNLIAPEQRTRILENVQRRAKGEPVPLFYETRGLGKDGSTFDMDVRVSTYELDQEIYTVVIMRDITASKQAQDELREREEMIRALIETSKDWIWSIDLQGVHTYCNPAVKAILGYRVEELLGKQSFDLIHDQDRIRIEASLPEWTREKRGWNNQLIRWRHKNGSYRYLESNAVPILNAENELIGFRGVDRDITERKRAEEALHQYMKRLEILHEIDQGVLAARSPQAIAQAVVSHVRQLIPCRRIGLVSLDFAANEVVVLAVDEDTESEIREGMHVPLEPFEDVSEELRQGRIVAWGDLLSRGQVSEILYSEGIRAYISVPLIARGELVGALQFGMAEQAALSQEQEELARQVAAQLAIAIQQAELYEQIQRQSQELEQRAADRTRELAVLYEVAALASQSLELETKLSQSLEQALRAMRSEAGAIHLLNESDGTTGDETAAGEVFRLAVQRGIPPSLADELESLPANAGLGKLVAGLDRPLVVADITSDPRVAMTLPGMLREASQSGSGGGRASPIEPHAYVGVPLRASGRTLGILSVVRRTEQPEHSVEELSLLISIADQLGLVVESERLRMRAEQAAVLEERERLARDLHDSVTQLLYTVSLFATTGKGALGAGDQELLGHALNQLENASQQALKEMRLMLHELRPPVLAQLGLVGALRRRLESVEGRVGIDTRLLAGKALEIPQQIEQELYLIALEALNNGLKHANATSVTVAVAAGEGQIELKVIDNGVGFDDLAAEGGGLGLTNMRQRAERLGGALRIISAPGAGAQVVATVPYNKDHQGF